MSELYAVLLANSSGSRVRVGYSPLTGKALAEQCAAFLTANVDPAYVVPLRDMTRELLHSQQQLATARAEARDAGASDMLTWLLTHITLTDEQLQAMPAEVLAFIRNHKRAGHG